MIQLFKHSEIEKNKNTQWLTDQLAYFLTVLQTSHIKVLVNNSKDMSNLSNPSHYFTVALTM